MKSTETLKKLRLYLNITGANQSFIAREIGISKVTISRWVSEKDPYTPCDAVVDKIKEYLDGKIKRLHEEFND